MAHLGLKDRLNRFGFIRRWRKQHAPNVLISSYKCNRNMEKGIVSVRCFVANLESLEIGTLYLYPGNFERSKFEYAVLFDLFVKSKFRGYGIAIKLVEKAIIRSREIGFKYLFVSTSAQNFKAHQLYLKLGFVKLDNTQQILPEGFKKEISRYNREMVGYYLYLKS